MCTAYCKNPTNLRLPRRLQSLGVKRNRTMDVDVFSVWTPDAWRHEFPHSRCSLTPFSIAPLTTSSPRRFSLGKRMRGEAGKSCDRQIKCEYFDPIYCWLCFGSGLAPLFKQVRFVTRENWFLPTWYVKYVKICTWNRTMNPLCYPQKVL